MEWVLRWTLSSLTSWGRCNGAHALSSSQRGVDRDCLAWVVVSGAASSPTFPGVSLLPLVMGREKKSSALVLSKLIFGSALAGTSARKSGAERGSVRRCELAVLRLGGQPDEQSTHQYVAPFITSASSGRVRKQQASREQVLQFHCASAVIPSLPSQHGRSVDGTFPVRLRHSMGTRMLGRPNTLLMSAHGWPTHHAGASVSAFSSIAAKIKPEQHVQSFSKDLGRKLG